MLIAADLIGAKLHALVERGGVESLTWEATGAIIAVLLALPVATRMLSRPLSLGFLGDVFAPSVAFAMAVGRLGCFLNGCCFGTVSASHGRCAFQREARPWARHVSAGLIAPDASASLAVHPLQLYFGLMSLGVGCLLAAVSGRKRSDGEVLLLLLAVYSGAQFLLEFLRADPAPHVQLLSLVLAVTGLALLAQNRSRSLWTFAGQRNAD